MSTRATYQFKQVTDSSVRHSPLVTFYIHHDGYPDGAASYFHAALELQKSNGGGFAECFVRANTRAEFTLSHEVHGDTDFRYTFTDGFLRVNRRYGETWATAFYGELAEFIKAHPRLIEEQVTP